MIITKKLQRGFTLIELLVVIAIIGILTTLVASNLTQAQARARDARRKSDLRVVAQGLEMYYSQRGQYPAPGTNTGQFAFWNTSAATVTTLTDGTDTYIKAIPKDPRNVAASNFEYYYCTQQNTAGTRVIKYNLYARLENGSDPDRFCGASDWSGTTCEFAPSGTICGTGSAGTAGNISNIVSTSNPRSNYVVADP